MTHYQLIRGFDTHGEAQGYTNRLPDHAKARVVPYTDNSGTPLFAVDVSRYYVDGRLKED